MSFKMKHNWCHSLKHNRFLRILPLTWLFDRSQPILGSISPKKWQKSGQNSQTRKSIIGSGVSGLSGQNWGIPLIETENPLHIRACLVIFHHFRCEFWYFLFADRIRHIFMNILMVLKSILRHYFGPNLGR